MMTTKPCYKSQKIRNDLKQILQYVVKSTKNLEKVITINTKREIKTAAEKLKRGVSQLE